MTEDNQRRFYRGSARWIIIGIVAAVAVIFVVVVAFGSTLFPSAPRTEMQSETADESATSGPGHNTTMSADVPLASEEGEEEEAVASTPPGAEQIPDAYVTFGRETSTLDTPTAGQQGVNNSTGNGTNGSGGLENPLSENITSLTGT
jgi:FtsZ-interacting cell division protein ZipA